MSRTTLVALALAAAAPAAERPNVLFLFADDLRADCLGALGHPVVKTPHLDALVRDGFAFRNAYCLGANVGAVCTPSRNMLLSGRAYFRWTGNLAPADGPSFPRTMRDAGYETYHHGKNNNTARILEAQFDHNKRIANDEQVRRSGRPGEAIVDDAIRFVADRKRDRPFFMYLAFEAPHDPRVPAAADAALYDRDQLPLPKNYLSLHPFDNGEMTVRDEKLAPWPRTEAEVRRHLHDYYGVITGLDRNIGRLLATLKETGQAGNTLIVFSSDHGLAVGSHGLMGKQSVYDHSMKVPLVVAGPGVPHGQSNALTYLLDIFPTVAELCGAKVPAGLDGHSLAPVIAAKATGVRDLQFLAYRDSQRAVRDGRWKLIRYPLIDKTQLFDLAADPDETHDVAAEHPGRVDAMMALLRTQQAVYGDKAPLTVPNPKPAAFVPPKP